MIIKFKVDKMHIKICPFILFILYPYYAFVQKLNEEALAHATMQYNMQVASLRSDLTTATSNSDRERSGREKVEAEVRPKKCLL